MKGLWMKEKLPFWSLIFAMICLLLFIVSLSRSISFSFYFILFTTLVTFLFSLYSLIGIRNFTGMVMSVTAIIVTIGLAVILIFVIFIGNMTSG